MALNMRRAMSWLAALALVFAAGASFEVRARAKVDGLMPLIYLPSVYYGEYSDTATFPAP